MRETRYIHLKRTGDCVTFRGESSCRLGQVDVPEALSTGEELYAEWEWDGREIVLRTCRYGFVPLYYFSTGSEFGASNSIEALVGLGAPLDLDEAALSVFLRFGWFIGDDTMFKAIKIVPPGGTVRWAGGPIIRDGGPVFGKQDSISRAAAVEGFGRIFRSAMRRRSSARVPTALPLSGGRDSRHILLELCALGCPPIGCFTTHDFSPFREGNIRVAKSLCERLGLAHHVVRQPPSRLAAEIEKNKLTSFSMLEGAWGLALYKGVSHAAAVVYDGLAGDSLSQSSYLNRDNLDLLERGQLPVLATKLIDAWSWRHGEEALKRILLPAAQSTFTRDLAIGRVAQELAVHQHVHNPLGSFNFWNRARRVPALGPFSIQPACGLVALTPYLDHELFDFLSSLPTSILLSGTLHDDVINRMHPAFADIPYSSELRTPQLDRHWEYRRFLLGVASYLVANGKNCVLNKIATTRRLVALSATERSNLHRRADSYVAPRLVLCLAQLERLIAAAESSGAALLPSTLN